MQPRSERRVPINSTTEVRLSTTARHLIDGALDIASVTSTTVVVLTASVGGVSSVNDFYQGLRFLFGFPSPKGIATSAQRDISQTFQCTDYVGSTRTLTFIPALTASGNIAAGNSVLFGPDLPAAFAELNIGDATGVFRISEVVGGTLSNRTDYQEIAAGLFRTYSGSHGGRGKISDLFISSGSATDTITVEYK